MKSDSLGQMLHTIVSAIAAVTGEDFYRALVKSFAEVFSVRCAYVGEFSDEHSRMRTLACWEGNDFRENFECVVANSPCGRVLDGDILHCAAGVCEQFPGDDELRVQKANGYLAVPLFDVKCKVTGVLALVDRNDLTLDKRGLSVLQLFAGRAGAELERKRADAARHKIERRLSQILATAMDAVVTINEERRIVLFNAAAEKMFGCNTEDVMDGSFDPFLTPKLGGLLEQYLYSCETKNEMLCYIWAPQGIAARRLNGEEFPMEGTVSQAIEGGQKFYTIILRDINEKVHAVAEIQRLELERGYLEEQIHNDYNLDEFIGQSHAIKKVLQNIQKVADTDTPVLITGETGTGKELIARKLHSLSRRRQRSLIKVNTAALPAGLVESEFFGHEKGAFTGAMSRKLGRFELADAGSIFLDEIGDVSLDVQAKLLRVLQENEFERVGGVKTLKVDVRLITATNHDLKVAVAEGRFRSDLYYRLNVFPIHVPPLRERKEDIPLLVYYFMNKHEMRLRRGIKKVKDKAMDSLVRYDWPGNIRELSNVIERGLIVSTSDTLNIELESGEQSTSTRLEDIERAHIIKMLRQTNWVINGPKGAARLMGLPASTLRNRMKKLRIHR